MMASTVLKTRPSLLVATTSMMLGPASRVTVVEKKPNVSTVTETPLTEAIASGPVRPDNRRFLSDTMLWSRGSVIISKNGWGGSAKEVTVKRELFRFPWESLATTSMAFAPGISLASELNLPSRSTAVAWPLIATVAPGVATPWTTTASPRTWLPSKGARS